MKEKYDIITGAMENGHTSTVWDVCFDSDGCFMATCSDDLTVKIWSLRLSHGEFLLRIMIRTLIFLVSCACYVRLILTVSCRITRKKKGLRS